MTRARATYRQRRTGTGGADIPDELAAWFAGEYVSDGSGHALPWSALIYPDWYLLPDRWRAWAADHPGATPPPRYEWIASPEPFKGHAAGLVEEARRVAGVSVRRK